MGVVGAAGSAGGAGVKYKKTKNRKEKGDEEMEQYKEAAEKNQIKILNLMTGLPKHIINKMYESENIPEEEMAWLKDMMQNYLAVEETMREEKKDMNKEFVISGVIGAREGFHAVKETKHLIHMVQGYSATADTATATADAATAATDVAMAGASVGVSAMKVATASVGSVFLIWDTYNMVVGVNDLIKKKPAGAGEFLRKQADELYQTCDLCGRHTFYNVPPGSPRPELCNCASLKDPWVQDWLSLTRCHPRYAGCTEEARKVVLQKLPLTCKVCEDKGIMCKFATENGLRAHKYWLHGRDKLDEKEQLVEAMGHNLIISTYKKITKCDHCKKTLWGARNQVWYFIPFSSTFPRACNVPRVARTSTRSASR